MEKNWSLNKNWEDLKMTMLPDGKKGSAEVASVTATKQGVEFHNLRCAIQPGMWNRSMVPGEYKQLLINHGLVMSDTRAEIMDHHELIYNRNGRILIHGLGLGMAARACLLDLKVSHITVIEINEDVIDLVAPTIYEEASRISGNGRDRISIIHDDAFTWKPPRGSRWDFAWHDIWPNICTTNLKDMKTLHRRFGRRVKQQASWCRGLCEIYA